MYKIEDYDLDCSITDNNSKIRLSGCVCVTSFAWRQAFYLFPILIKSIENMYEQ